MNNYDHKQHGSYVDQRKVSMMMSKQMINQFLKRSHVIGFVVRKTVPSQHHIQSIYNYGHESLMTWTRALSMKRSYVGQNQLRLSW